ASHTVTHQDLTKATTSQLNYELAQSKADLSDLLGVTAKNLASPYGAYNTKVVNAVKPLYRSHRTVDEGYNTKENFDPYHLKVQNIILEKTTDDVAGWVNQAKADKSWLIVVDHSVDDPDYAE